MRIAQHPLLCFLAVSISACSGAMRSRDSVQVPANDPAEDATPEAPALAAPSAPAPTPAEVEELIARGRVELDAGRPAEAEAFFARAAADGSLGTRQWLLRAWIEQGRSDETLAALDVLARDGAQGPELSYLYGMAFARRAEDAVASGTTGSSVQMNFLDATAFLKEAIDADGARFDDAVPVLARAAWYAQELDTARWAADRSVESRPEAPERWLVRGRVALSQFVAARSAASDVAGDLQWTDATSSFERAVELLGTPQDEADALGLAQAATELGNALLWKQEFARAGEAFATAIAWAPEAFDYGRTRELLAGAPASPDGAPAGFRAVLEEGRARFESRAGTADERAGVLWWWLGWARFGEADWKGSEEAFLASLARGPQFTNAWFYVGLARQYAKDPSGALAAMHAGWDADPATMVATAQGAGGSLRAFEDLIAWCASQEPAQNLEAAFLAEMLTRAFPDEPRHWNNLGLFLRDEGERLEIDAHREKAPEPDPAILSPLYERSFVAYQRALELNPDDPQLINDSALMLHYHLERELDRVEAMYRRSIELSDARLAAADLSEDDRARFEQTKSDALENLEWLLEPELAKEKAEAKKAAREAEKAAQEAAAQEAAQEAAAQDDAAQEPGAQDGAPSTADATSPESP